MRRQFGLNATAVAAGAVARGRHRYGASMELPSLSQRIDDWLLEYGRGHTVAGSTPSASSIVLASNDYLCLANDRRIVQAQIEALGNGSNVPLMSSVYVQHLQTQREFERAVADFLGAEEAVLCQSGWAANDGLIQTLATPETPVYVDLYAHASLWQGIQSAGARPRAFRHNSPGSLQSLLRRFGPGIVVVDAVYSTNGDICPIADIVALSEEHGCMLVVDESHSLGIWGEQGEGLVAAAGLADRVHFRTASLSKAFVGRGGIVTGTARALEYFRYVSRPAIFSSAVLPYEVAGFLATLAIIRSEPWRRERLRQHTAYLRERLNEAGYAVGRSSAPIIALHGGPEERTKLLRDALERRDIFGAVFCAPATPKSRSLVRLSLNCDLTQPVLDRVAEVCVAVREQIGQPVIGTTGFKRRAGVVRGGTKG